MRLRARGSAFGLSLLLGEVLAGWAWAVRDVVGRVGLLAHGSSAPDPADWIGGQKRTLAATQKA